MATLQQSAKTRRLPSQPPKPQKVSDDYLRFLPWLFLAPALAIYSVVVAYPMVYSSYLSLFRWDGVSPAKVFVGLENYVTLLTQNEVFWIALRNNAIWLVAALLLPTSIGLGFAILLNSKFRREVMSSAASFTFPLSCPWQWLD